MHLLLEMKKDVGKLVLELEWLWEMEITLALEKLWARRGFLLDEDD
jgi:hypothetical protein